MKNCKYQLDQNGRFWIKGFEGFRSKPYLCSAGVPTIGWGNTYYPNGRKVTLKDKPITVEYGDYIFDFVADLFAKDVCSLLPDNIDLTQNQFNMLVSIAYNIGSDIDADDIAEGLGDSTLLKKVIKNPNDPSIAKEFNKWVFANGKKSNGLVIRRNKESVKYFEK